MDEHRLYRVVTALAALASCLGLLTTLSITAATLGAEDPGEDAKPPESADGQTEPSAPDEPEPWRPPTPRSMKQRIDERHAMVKGQIASGRGGRIPVRDATVLNAMRTTPRHAFVPASAQQRAYHDRPQRIGHGQTISQPYIVGIMTDLLKLKPDSNVLEIGTGSGYQTAVLAQLTPHVYSIEIVEALHKRAAGTLKAEGYNDIQLKFGDGYHGWKEHAPFDAIIVTCAAGHLPEPLWAQLKPGGRIVIPIGSPYVNQRLVVVTKTEDGKRRSRTVLGVRFVPMTGQAMRSK